MQQPTRQPSEDQLGALKRFAAAHGAQWKAKLAAAWPRDIPGPDGALLRQLRNNFGPTWLNRFKLPA